MHKLSLILMVWNTSHLLKRTLETLRKQTLDDWELLIVDDMSPDDVPQVLEPFSDLPIQYHRLEHSFGMRGNTAALNYGIQHTDASVAMWSTPEVMLPPETLETVYNTVMAPPLPAPRFVTIPSHGLSYNIQMQLNTVDWRANLHAIKDIPKEGFDSRWFWLNFYEEGDLNKPKRTNYGNNQTVAVHKELWLQRVGLFPLYLDYGSDDPWVSNERKQRGYQDITLWQCEGYHQWHPNCQYWMAQGLAPHWNRHGHTTSNLMGDPRVPEGGTCVIWDGGDRTPMNLREIEQALMLRPQVEATRSMT
jgi:hypothetical protein